MFYIIKNDFPRSSGFQTRFYVINVTDKVISIDNVNVMNYDTEYINDYDDHVVA